MTTLMKIQCQPELYLIFYYKTLKIKYLNFTE